MLQKLFVSNKQNRFKFSNVGDEDEPSDYDEKNDNYSGHIGQITAFNLYSKSQGGRVALMYKETFDKPQIWFQV